MALTDKSRDIRFAPLVRKPKSGGLKGKGSTPPSLNYQAPSVIPGIPHTVEGAPSGYSFDPNQSWGRQRPGERKLEVDKFKKKQEARKRIAPIADPDAGEAERKRRAARRRRRGRLGTMLSERETLG